MMRSGHYQNAINEEMKPGHHKQVIHLEMLIINYTFMYMYEYECIYYRNMLFSITIKIHT